MRHVFADGAVFSFLFDHPTLFCRVEDGVVKESTGHRTQRTTHEGFYGNLIQPSGEITRAVVLFEPYWLTSPFEFHNEYGPMPTYNATLPP